MNLTKKITRIIIVCISVFFLFSFQELSCQDIPYSQQFSNLVSINPAFSGTTLSNRSNYFYRTQWFGLSSGINDFGFEYDTYLRGINSGLGFIFRNESQGILNKPSLDVAYSYIIKLNHTMFLSMGLQVGINQKYMSKSNIDFRDKEELSFGNIKTYPDFSTGVVLLSKNTYLGLSADHLHEPYITNKKTKGAKIYRKYTLFAGYIYALNTSLIHQESYISPNFLYQNQAMQQNITWGFSFQYQTLVGGLWMRNNLTTYLESLIISLGYKTKSVRFTYSYDINVLKKTTKLLGAHELSLTYVWEKRGKNNNERTKSMSFLR